MTLISGPANLNPPVNASADPEFNSLAIAPVPPVLGTDTDAARQFYRRGVSQLRMSPLPTQAKIAVGAQSQSQVIITQVSQGGGGTSGSSGISLLVNGVSNPIQNILNLTGVGVSYGPGKGQVSIFAGYQEIQQAGVPKPAEPILNFLAPITVTDNPGNTSSDVAVPVMVGDSGSGGVKGLVPAPASGSAAAGKFLKADGTFQVPPGTGGVANYQTVEAAGSSKPQEPVLNFLAPFVVADNPGNTSTDISITTPGISAFTHKTLSAPVSLSSNTATQIDTISVTMPAYGGPWYIRVNYFYAKLHGGNHICWAADNSSHKFAASQGSTTNGNDGLAASGLSPVTYANGAMVIFSVNAIDDTNSTVEVDTSTEGGNPSSFVTIPSYMQVEVIPSV